jgi:hypothetical protein
MTVETTQETSATTTETETTEAQAPDSGKASDENRAGNREARYRVERNEAREALSQAEALIGSLHTREIERLAGEHLAQPADLLALGGVELTDLLTDEGYVDAEAVAEVAAALIESRPGLAKNPRHPAIDLSQGMGNNPGRGRPSWGDLFKD